MQKKVGTKVMSFRFTNEELKWLDQEAKTGGYTSAYFIRWLICRAHALRNAGKPQTPIALLDELKDRTEVGLEKMELLRGQLQEISNNVTQEVVEKPKEI